MTAEIGDIKWEEPEDNGGSPITNYIVEARDVNRRSWREVGKPQPTQLEFTIDKLMEGNQYLFKIQAENHYGISDPVEIPDPVTAKNPYGM